MDVSPKMIFPRAFAFAVDDLGWNEGSDMSGQRPSGPYRAGVKRAFDLSDYQHLITVGEKVGVRIQCLFILSEMDRENTLARYPSTTFQGSKWDNKRLVNDRQPEIMQHVIAHSAFMEFGLHGTGHEYWKGDGIQRRAEWYNLTDHEPWPESSMEEHLRAFQEIMAQYGITKNNGHSFPESFVPCAYSYYWNPSGAYSLGKLLRQAGVKYANTDFSQIPELNPPQEINGGGFDHGIHVINRLNYGNPWYKLDSLPVVAPDLQETDIIESHWPNWLAQDDHLQPDVTARWIHYYETIQRSDNRYVAKNTEQLHSQWLYKKYARLTETTAGLISIDNTAMPDEAYRFDLPGNLVLKIKLNPGQHIASAVLNGERIAAIFENAGYCFLYVPPLEREKYELHYTIGNSRIPVCVVVDGTFNIYKVLADQSSLAIDLKMYGTQIVRIHCTRPTSVVSHATALVVLDYRFDDLRSCLEVTLKGTDMQGTRGKIVVGL